VLKTFGENTQRENLGLGHCLSRRCAIGKDAGKLRNFSEPTPVFFSFDIKSEFHRLAAYTIAPM